MRKYAHLREKALALRQQGLTLTEICNRLALGKSTVHYWIRGLPLARHSTWQTPAQRLGTHAMQAKYAARRQAWYAEALRTAPEVLRDPVLRDFAVLYAAEGFRRDRNQVAVCNSNPAILQIAHKCIARLSPNPKRYYRLQCHQDNDEAALKQFWAGRLQIDAAQISVMRKSNAGALHGRQWRSQHGVLTIQVNDTRLRCIIQAWMDYLAQQWSGAPNGA